MNKKFNTVIFIIGATLFNTILIVVVLAILFRVTLLIIGPEVYESIGQTLLPVLLVASLVAAFFIYRLILKQVEKKIKLDDYFEPFFRRKR